MLLRRGSSRRLGKPSLDLAASGNALPRVVSSEVLSLTLERGKEVDFGSRAGRLGRDFGGNTKALAEVARLAFLLGGCGSPLACCPGLG
jgi:hypothetical protein